jgi:hypothetical protein
MQVRKNEEKKEKERKRNYGRKDTKQEKEQRKKRVKRKTAIIFYFHRVYEVNAHKKDFISFCLCACFRYSTERIYMKFGVHTKS